MISECACAQRLPHPASPSRSLAPSARLRVTCPRSRSCKGIEILGSLNSAAQIVVDRFEGGGFLPMLNTAISQEVQCVKGSFLDDCQWADYCPWADGDVIFANSTCFDDELMEGMSEEAARLSPGAYFITFTKGLSSDKFEVLERKRYKMSWGPATVFIHRRLNEDGTSVSGSLTEIADDESYNEARCGRVSSPPRCLLLESRGRRPSRAPRSFARSTTKRCGCSRTRAGRPR